jgi:hypothetical protein
MKYREHWRAKQVSAPLVRMIWYALTFGKWGEWCRVEANLVRVWMPSWDISVDTQAFSEAMKRLGVSAREATSNLKRAFRHPIAKHYVRHTVNAPALRRVVFVLTAGRWGEWERIALRRELVPIHANCRCK